MFTEIYFSTLHSSATVERHWSRRIRVVIICMKFYRLSYPMPTSVTIGSETSRNFLPSQHDNRRALPPPPRATITRINTNRARYSIKTPENSSNSRKPLDCALNLFISTTRHVNTSDKGTTYRTSCYKRSEKKERRGEKKKTRKYAKIHPFFITSIMRGCSGGVTFPH